MPIVFTLENNITIYICNKCYNTTEKYGKKCLQCDNPFEKYKCFYWSDEVQAFKCHCFCTNIMDEYNQCTCHPEAYFVHIYKHFDEKESKKLLATNTYTEEKNNTLFLKTNLDSGDIDRLIKDVNEFFPSYMTNYLFDLDTYIDSLPGKYNLCHICLPKQTDFLLSRVNKFCYIWLWQYFVIDKKENPELLNCKEKLIEKLINVYKFTKDDIRKNLTILNRQLMEIHISNHNFIVLHQQ